MGKFGMVWWLVRTGVPQGIAWPWRFPGRPYRMTVVLDRRRCWRFRPEARDVILRIGLKQAGLKAGRKPGEKSRFSLEPGIFCVIDARGGLPVSKGPDHRPSTSAETSRRREAGVSIDNESDQVS